MEKKRLLLFIEIVCILIVIVFVFFNSMILEGQEVENYSYGSQSVVGYSGYIYDENVYWLENKENHYITFEHNNLSDTFSVVFNRPSDENKSIHVWYMDGSGNIKKEYDKKWEKNKYVISFSDIENDSSLVSISIDEDVDIYMTIDSNNVKNRCFRIVEMGIVSLILIIMIFLYKKHRLNKILDFVEKINNRIKIAVINNKIFLLVFPIVVSLAICVPFVFSVLFSPSFFNHKYIVLLFLFIYFVISVVRVLRKNNSFAAFSFLSIFLLGTMFAFLEPTSIGVSWDDEIHYDRAVQLSHVFDKKEYLVNDPFYHHYQAVALDHITYSKSDSKEYSIFYNEIYKEGFYCVNYDNKILLSRVVYFPMALGLVIARGINLPFNMCIIFGRWFNLILYASLAYIISKKAKYGEIIPTIIMLIPTNVFLASSYSYDTWVIEWSILGLVLLFNEMQSNDEKIDKKNLFLIPLSFCLASFAKQIYFVIAIAALFLSKEKFRHNKEKWIYRGLILLSMAIPFVLMYFERLISFSGNSDTRGGTEVNSGEQLKFVFGNFGKYITILFNFLKEYLNPVLCNARGNSYIDSLGYNGIMNIYPFVLIIIFVVAIIDHEDKRGAFPIWYRLGIILLYIGVGALCASALYVSFTPVGAEFIAGCQGRYIMPMIFPMVFVLSRIPKETKLINKIGKINIYAISVFLLVLLNIYCLWSGCIVRYI